MIDMSKDNLPEFQVTLSLCEMEILHNALQVYLEDPDRLAFAGKVFTKMGVDITNESDEVQALRVRLVALVGHDLT